MKQFECIGGNQIWESHRQKYIRGSEDLCFHCKNPGTCKEFQDTEHLRRFGVVWHPNCNFEPKYWNG